MAFSRGVCRSIVTTFRKSSKYISTQSPVYFSPLFLDFSLIYANGLRVLRSLSYSNNNVGSVPALGFGSSISRIFGRSGVDIDSVAGIFLTLILHGVTMLLGAWVIGFVGL